MAVVTIVLAVAVAGVWPKEEVMMGVVVVVGAVWFGVVMVVVMTDGVSR